MAGVPYNPNGSNPFGGGGSGGGSVLKKSPANLPDLGGQSRTANRTLLMGMRGRRQAGERQAAQDAYLEWLLGGGGGGGGGYGGGGGGRGYAAAVQAAFQGMKDRAASQYNDVSGRMKGIYGQFEGHLRPMAEQTRTRYDQAIAANEAQANRFVDSERSRIDQESADRAQTYAALGIADPQTPIVGDPSRAAGESEKAIGNILENAQNWSGFMGAGRESQVNRDQANLSGAIGAGALAQDSLLRQYNDYLTELEGQMSGYMGGGGGGGRGGGGGGGGSSDSKMMSKYKEALLGKFLGEQGIFMNSWQADAYGQKSPKLGALAELMQGYGVNPSQFNSGVAAWAKNSTSPYAKLVNGGVSPNVVALLNKAGFK